MAPRLLSNAIVRTMDPSRPRAGAIAVCDGRILSVGDEHESAAAFDGPYEYIDCRGGALLPAFIDAHCHLLAYASSLRAVACTDSRSFAEIQELIQDRAAHTPGGEWIRAFGYDETALVERRHPNRWDLDAAAPKHPLRLTHRSGHASVLNSLALRIAGITASTEEPAGGSIERDVTTGEPNGVLLDMEQRIDGALPRPPDDVLTSSVHEASCRMLRQGITCITDASHTNGREQWDLVERLIFDGAIAQRVLLMEGIDHLGELPVDGAAGRLRRGAVKIMIHELGDSMSPDEDELHRLVEKAHDGGRQVAIHAAGERAIGAAVAAIERAIEVHPRPDHRHRIEHCSMLPTGVAARIAEAGIIVVSQPGFLRERGERYLQLVPEDKRSSLYAFRTLADAGVMLTASSDAPVSPPVPLASVAGAFERTSAGGRAIAPQQSVEVSAGLQWWTANAARASFLESERGAIRPGLCADLVLLDPDPVECSPRALLTMGVKQVWAGGTPMLKESEY